MKVPSTISQNGEGPKQAFLVWRSPPDSSLCLHDAMRCAARLRVRGSRISEVLLATNVLSLNGGCERQAKTMVESHHACTSMSLCCSAILTDKNSRLRSKAPHSSRRGRNCCFSGATLAFSAMSETDTVPFARTTLL